MNIEPIDRFIKRVKGAASGRSKDVRMTIEDAQELVASIGELLVEHVQARQAVAEPEASTKIAVDGGSF